MTWLDFYEELRYCIEGFTPQPYGPLEMLFADWYLIILSSILDGAGTMV